ncbi:MAG: MIP/aquaporin family protein [Pseudomonadota bacterium]
MYSPLQKLSAEALGTALLLAIVIGSGIMGDALSSDDAVALLGNTVATGAGLVVLILIFGPVSGAHFNPAVSFSFFLQKQLSLKMMLAYILAQIIGAIMGVMLAHGMFELELIQASVKTRDSFGEGIAEIIATFALVLTIIATVRHRPESTPYAVGLIITAGYWYTSSTSFANPAVALARTFSNTFAGIEMGSIPLFIGAQFVGAAIATGLGLWFTTPALREAKG